MWPFDLPEIEESVFWESSQAWETCSLHFKDKNYNTIEFCKYSQVISLRINDISVYSAKAFNRKETDITLADITNVFSEFSDQLMAGLVRTVYISLDRNLPNGKVFSLYLVNRGSSFLFRGFCTRGVQALESAGEYIHEASNFIPDCLTRRCPDVAV